MFDIVLWEDNFIRSVKTSFTVMSELGTKPPSTIGGNPISKFHSKVNNLLRNKALLLVWLKLIKWLTTSNSSTLF